MSVASRRGNASAAEARLPLGVAVLSVLIGLFGFFVLADGLLVLLVGFSAGLAGSTTVLGLTGVLAGLVLSIVGVVIVAVATGLWDQELWALALALLVLMFYGAVELLADAWLAVVIIGALLVYLVAVSPEFR